MYRKSSGLFSRAEGCWTFDARDRTPRPSRATALHPVENKLRPRRALPSRASGFVLRRSLVVAARFAQGPLTKLTAGARAWQRLRPSKAPEGKLDAGEGDEGGQRFGE